MTAETHPRPATAVLYDNRQLFSDHYLATGAPSLAEWAEPLDGAWTRATQLFAEKRAILPGLNEAQTEEEWVKPLLTQVLGWSYSVQPDATLFGKRNRPDYVLFTSPAAKAASNGRGPPRYDTAAAVADAKFWARPLDRVVRDARDTLTNANPSFQIVTYLVATGVEWGILTNGKEWRLYSTRARSRVETYYAVDLERILGEGDAEAFRWFHLFFRAAAFRKDAASGQSFMDRMLDGSTRYGAELETRLKSRIYEEVFPYLARGFVHRRRRDGLPTDSPEALREVFEGTLRLLYRVLFVLYTEARGLLPVHEERGYGGYSLDRARRRVAEAAQRGDRLSDVAETLWSGLAQLFRILDRGDPALNVPGYSGALFDAEHPRNAFFKANAVADAFLYPALERLTLDADGHFIDYGSLSVQQLGSIYEGLLEYHLRVGDDGEVFPQHDKVERHGSGSYYTPSFIVEYIDHSTLGPGIEERSASFRALMEEIVPKRERLAAVRAKQAEDPRRIDAAASRWNTEAFTLEGELGRLERTAVDALLGIRVCDPAMGSGHFLVHATDWVTERLIVVLNEFPDNPVLRDLAVIRAHICESLTEQGIAPAPERLNDTHVLRRLVVKRCIYGVDVNPMAVELAQLSLWIDSPTYGAPLSFLDHHLKTGNSLVGTTIPAVKEATTYGRNGQIDALGGILAGMLLATIVMRDVANTADATFEEALYSSERYAEFEQMTAKYKALLDAWTSRAFGNKLATSLVVDYPSEVMDVAAGGRNPFGGKLRDALDQARALSVEYHMFHWDLEFPEIFCDLEYSRWKDDPGFETVVGNPPYVRQEQVGGIKPYLAAEYAAVHDGAADLYIYFYWKGLSLLRGGGRLSYIVTNKWLRAGYGQPLRGALARAARVERIVDFGHAPIFPDADVFPCIVLLRRRGEDEPPATEEETLVCIFPREALGTVEVGEYVREHGYAVPAARFTAAPWSLEPAEVERLMDKIRAAGVPLRVYAGTSPLYGIKTGFNEAFLVDGQTRDALVQQDPRSADLLKPYLRGQDVERWSPAWAGLWMILLPSSENRLWPWTGAPEQKAERLFEKEYPALHAHFKPMEAKLRKRTDQGQYWWELRSCAYYDAFERPKIIWKDLSFYSQFAFDAGGLFTNDLCFILPADDPHWLVAVLNSPLMWAYAWRNTAHGKDEVLRLKTLYTEPLPIAPGPASRAEVDRTVERLMHLTGSQRHAEREMLEWLRVEFGVETPGQKLEAFSTLDPDGFVAEVKRRRPRKAPGLGPRDLSRLTDTFGEYAPRVRELTVEAADLEERLAAIVNDAYGLTDDEVDLLWRTAPPRMPVRAPRPPPD